ncbi:exported hypothetical protein [Desulfamplus magnetovallimortis]|uniref:Outer membrane lipoprotein carrier protein LolA n=1 Tax=Desulfamplus magnetovallimortis TaxID=1246637 RepID=A0A1W1H7Z8_9BACT|nr:outer membrane lipoprotein carrier protein LolA [Desulfamplus magnetovallimortis]SLM28498.1 exported hypothetical protein [Desulfamplus magnetovallimortis]
MITSFIRKFTIVFYISIMISSYGIFFPLYVMAAQNEPDTTNISVLSQKQENNMDLPQGKAKQDGDQKLVSTSFSSEKEEAIVSAIEKLYSRSNFSCAYHQRSTLKALGISEDAWGRAFFSHPGKMRWEYKEPEIHKIISDGRNLWIYRPEEKQVLQGDAAVFFRGGAGGAFLSDISSVREDYTLFVSENNLDTTAIYLTMVPKNETPDIASIKIRVIKDSYIIQKVTTTNAYGDTTEITFSEIEFGELDDSLFHFTVPEGVDVIPMG